MGQRRICHQSIQKWTLPLEELGPGLRHREPADPVDLGEGLNPPGTFGPFEFEGIAARISEVEIASHSKRRDNLAAGLLQRWELDPRSDRRRQSDLLFELALRGCPRVFAVGVLPLGNRPDAVVLASPNRPTWVPDQDLDRSGLPREPDVVANPIEQQPCAQLGHRVAQTPTARSKSFSELSR